MLTALSVLLSALTVVSSINITLLLFANSWAFEEGITWLLPELALIVATTSWAYFMRNTKRWVKNPYLSVQGDLNGADGLEQPHQHDDTSVVVIDAQ